MEEKPVKPGRRKPSRDTDALTAEQAQRLVAYAAGVSVSAQEALLQVPGAEDGEALRGAGLVVLVLLTLYGEQRPKDLGRQVGLGSANTARLLDRLEGAGYVERSWGRVQEDRRAIMVTLTEEGERLAHDLGVALAALLPSPRVLGERLGRLLDPPPPPRPDDQQVSA